jgi:hypothetical protein
MAEIIALLDGYFFSPGLNFDRKRAEVSRVLTERVRSKASLQKICSAVACHYTQTTWGA